MSSPQYEGRKGHKGDGRREREGRTILWRFCFAYSLGLWYDCPIWSQKILFSFLKNTIIQISRLHNYIIFSQPLSQTKGHLCMIEPATLNHITKHHLLSTLSSWYQTSFVKNIFFFLFLFFFFEEIHTLLFKITNISFTEDERPILLRTYATWHTFSTPVWRAQWHGRQL